MSFPTLYLSGPRSYARACLGPGAAYSRRPPQDRLLGPLAHDEGTERLSRIYHAGLIVRIVD